MLAGARTARLRTARDLIASVRVRSSSSGIRRRSRACRSWFAAPPRSSVGVLLTAERGADVDSVARELHGRSRRAAAPYLVVECDGADASRLAQLLFGSMSRRRPLAPAPTDLEPIARDSRIAAARGGTLFLQDVTELPAAVQARLARIARDGEVSIDGEPVATDVRLIASASPAVDADVHAHRLRSDLFRRLAAVRIDLPPLRDRQEDVPAIAARVLEDVARGARAAAARVHAGGAGAGRRGDVAGQSGRAAGGHRARRPASRAITTSRWSTCCRRCICSGRPRASRRPATCAKRGCGSSAITFRRSSSITRWRMADAAQTLGIQRPNLYRKARQLGIPVTRMSE